MSSSSSSSPSRMYRSSSFFAAIPSEMSAAVSLFRSTSSRDVVGVPGVEMEVGVEEPDWKPGVDPGVGVVELESIWEGIPLRSIPDMDVERRGAEASARSFLAPRRIAAPEEKEFEDMGPPYDAARAICLVVEFLACKAAAVCR